MENQFEMVFAIINSGYSEEVMDAVKECGATGGTILNARGTANTEIEKFFGISISSEKELVMIIIPTSIKKDVLHAIYQKVGLDTPGQGIAFTVPVDDVVGINKLAVTNMLEEEIDGTIDDNVLNIQFRPFEIKTIKAYY